MITIQKQFAPMTLKLETEEDLHLLREVLRTALHNNERSWLDHPFRSVSKKQGEIYHTVLDLIKALQ